ncbi:serine hydrolase domain-containing protein [Streptomyces sp. CT34]|uniref:serine hydrolase domain-containing protein n=1 Tax=Streptomyces sp. CT34 TaxID=1553907 RepID=UPI0012FF050D|nr:serine hydrolase domain-containing protein [Streptomyces sp. CT34]
MKSTVRPWCASRRLRYCFALMGITAMAVLGIGLFFAPHPAVLSNATTGDATLAAQVKAAADGGYGYRGLSVAVVDPNGARFAGLGDSGNPGQPSVDRSTVFEAGSLGKPMTGMLLAELASRHTLQLDKPLQELLPDVHFSDPALRTATLSDLASHRAGLDLMPSSIDTFVRGVRLRILGKDPYQGMTEDDVFAAAKDATTSGTGTFRYSNLGMALAGQTAARVLGRSYQDLLQQYVLAPLKMRNTRTVHSNAEIPRNSAAGQKATGADMEHWMTSGYTPAGDVWSTSEDLARLLRSVMLGTSPGAEAAVPKFDADSAGRIGLDWYTTRIQGREITWHDGETGGFTSYMGFDRSSRKGVVILSNTDQPVDVLGKRLLGISPDRTYPSHGESQILLTVLCSVGAAGPVFNVAWRRFPTSIYRIYFTLSVCFGITLLIGLRRVGDWLSVPPIVWMLGCGLLFSGFWLGIWRWPPTESDQKDRRGFTLALLGVRYAFALLTLLLLVVSAEL